MPNQDGAPGAVQKEADVVASRGCACGVRKQFGDEIVPLGNDRQRRQKPTVADTALQEIFGRKSVIRHDYVRREAFPT